MKTSSFRRRVGVGLVVALVAIPLGCSKGGDGLVVARGKLLKNGLPYVAETANLAPGESAVYIYFSSVDQPGLPEVARYDAATATFTVAGPTKKGIPPGRYKIAISNKGLDRMLFAMPGSPKEKATKDALDAFSLQKSKLVREVKANEEIVIDLAKPHE